jgi:thiol-disulfide isomerase/thioredoxin
MMTLFKKRAVIIGFAALIITSGVAYTLYGMKPVSSNASQEVASLECKAAQIMSKSLKPLAKGEIAALTIIENPTPLPDLAFVNAENKPLTLKDFRGKTILLNLWATWCAPCRHEMPALDKLQASLGSDRFEVVAVNIDTRNLEKPAQWLKDNAITKLGYYADPQAKIFQDLKRIGKAVGMPATLLIDEKGCAMANLNGPAEWGGKEALALVKQALK